MFSSPSFQPTLAEREIRSRISKHKAIDFAEFMQVALYEPGGGYYAGGSPIGSLGDFYTAPHTHPVFGALLARWLWGCWRALDSPNPFWVIELGAGSGRLAEDISAYSPIIDVPFANSLRYVALDVRAPRGKVNPEVDWLLANDLPIRHIRGVVLANELLDAMPVHRVVGHADGVKELGVGISETGALTSVFLDDVNPALGDRFTSLGVTLAVGHRSEVNLDIGRWMHSLANALDSGYVLVVDYGHDAADYYNAARSRGTLRCYYQHTMNMDPYSHVGRQDIGAHVEFTSVRREAELAGFSVSSDTNQADLLRKLGFEAHRMHVESRNGLRKAVQTANLAAMDELVDPEALGAFRALTLRKGVESPDITGVPASPSVNAPLLGPHHLPRSGYWGQSPMPTWEELSL